MDYLGAMGATQLVGHLAYALTLGAYLVRDILILRSLLLAAGVTMLAYFMVGMADVAWTPFFWQIVLLLVNLVWVVLLVRERQSVRFTEEERELHETLFREFSALEFMKLLRAGDWRSLAEGDDLTQRGEPVERLYLVSNGEVEVDRGSGREPIRVRDGGLIGEMSFLNASPATATVRATCPTRCLTWNQEELRSLLRRNPSMRGVLMSVIGSDLTHKLSSPGSEYSGDPSMAEQPG